MPWGWLSGQCRLGRKEEGEEALLYSPAHPGWKLWPVTGHLPEPHSLQCPCKAITRQSQGLRRIEAASLSSFPDAYSLSIAAKCLPPPPPTCRPLHISEISSTSSASWNHFIKGWEEENKCEASVGHLGSPHPFLCLFTPLLLSSFLEGISHNFTNFISVPRNDIKEKTKPQRKSCQ